VSIKTTLWYGEDERGHNVHIYCEPGERNHGAVHAEAIYMEIDWEGKQTTIRFPKELGENVLHAFDSEDECQVL
jgi:hypothetical protein